MCVFFLVSQDDFLRSRWSVCARVAYQLIEAFDVSRDWLAVQLFIGRGRRRDGEKR